MCVLGDGEINAGVIWEGAMTAAKYRLGNLTAILDYNGIQQTGATADVMPTEPIADKWEAFGWHVQEIHGHNVGEILDALDRADEVHARPSIIIARTTKGKGVSFMEYDHRWHGMSPNQEQYEQALAELEEGLKPWQNMIPMRKAYGEALVELGQANPDVVALSADVSNSDFSYMFQEAFPDRFFNVGIAEQSPGGRGRRAGLQRQDPLRQHLRLPVRHPRAGDGAHAPVLRRGQRQADGAPTPASPTRSTAPPTTPSPTSPSCAACRT